MHLIELENYDLIIENKKFHTKKCCEADYKYIVNKESSNINIDCFNIRYSSLITSMLKRGTSELDIHTNHKFMSYTQLDLKLKKNADRINNLKLEILNKDYKIITQQNKIDLYKRFNVLICNNDVPRLKQLLSVCLNNGDGINSILNKFTLAANNFYKAKGWSDDDLDLAYLVLRVGGPALLYTFSKQNMLPSSSYIYKVVHYNLILKLFLI